MGEIVDGGVSGTTAGRMGDNLDVLKECGVLDISEVRLWESQCCPCFCQNMTQQNVHFIDTKCIHFSLNNELKRF